VRYSFSVGPKNFSRLLGEKQEKRHRENLFIINFLRSTTALLDVAIKFLDSYFDETEQ